mgnify:CR=1 FL=1
MNNNIFKGGANNNQPTPPPENTSGISNKKNNKEPKKVMASAFNVIPSLVNTIIKLLPFGLYISSVMESVLFNDLRGFFIFLGLILNDCLNTASNYLFMKKDNDRCAVVRNMHSEDYYVLPTPHTEYISFISAFLMTSMFFKKIFNYGLFVVLAILVATTMYMRVSIGCKDFIDAGYSFILGCFKGIIYYIIVKDFYEPVDVTPEDHWIEKAIKKYIPYSDSDDELFT